MELLLCDFPIPSKAIGHTALLLAPLHNGRYQVTSPSPLGSVQNQDSGRFELRYSRFEKSSLTDFCT